MFEVLEEVITLPLVGDGVLVKELGHCRGVGDLAGRRRHMGDVRRRRRLGRSGARHRAHGAWTERARAPLASSH